MKPALRLVRPLEQLAIAEMRACSPKDKLAHAIAYLRSRNLYVLDADSRAPKWGLPFAKVDESPLMKAVMEADRRRK